MKNSSRSWVWATMKDGVGEASTITPPCVLPLMGSWSASGTVFPPQPASVMLDYQPRTNRRTSTREGRRVADCHRPPVARAVASLSVLRSQQGRLIFSIHVYFRDAGLWAGMVGRC